MRTLIAPMHGSIGSIILGFTEMLKVDRVLLIHPWKDTGAAHANSKKLASFLQRQLEKSNEKNRKLGESGKECAQFEVRALNCYEKAIDICIAFEKMITTDRNELFEKSDLVEPSYHVIMTEDTPIGYSFGLMALSGVNLDIGCHIGTIGFDVRKPRRDAFDPGRPNIETFERIPLLGDIQDVRAWLGKKRRTGARSVFNFILGWYSEDEMRWEENSIFKTSQLVEYSAIIGEEWTQSRISNQIRNILNDLPVRQHLIEIVEPSGYRITPLGKLIGRSWKSIIDS